MSHLDTDFKDVNTQRIQFTGQTKATVKTNNKTLELQLVLTETTTSPLIELDWMQQLGIHLNTNNSEIQRHNIKMDDTGKNSTTEKQIQGSILQQQR